MTETKKRCKVCKKYQEKFANKNTCEECFNKPPPKYYFTVNVSTWLPATLTYRVFTEDAQQAAEMIRNMQPTSVQYKLAGKRDLKITVYEYGCCVIKFIKNLAGF